MNDSAVKTSSCLAITEKKAQTHGGCVGIFFQLLDWKRRLAKKKLFSKKLLPLARAKQASKKFRGDEKMPNSKLYLIANENSGGFPSAKKGGNRGVDVEQKHEMRVPGLVARLMGLESIPTAQRDNSKKALHSDTCGDGEKGSLGNQCESDRKGVDSEMGAAKHDSRPQKLQKTETCERKVVTRFGAEALQIKSVLSRARKHNHHHHHPKLASPLKNPRITSGKSSSRSSRLIGAATKILEPGLQARSKAKCSLTCSASIYPPKSGIVTDGVETRSAVIQNQSGYDVNLAKPLMGQTSCKNCGNLLDVVDCRPEVEGQLAVPPPNVSDVITSTSMIAAQKKGRSFTLSLEQERDVVLLRSEEKLISHVTEEDGKNNAQQSFNEPTTRKMPLPREGPATCNSSRQPCRTLEDDGSSLAFKNKSRTEERILSSERISSGSRTSNLQVKRVPSAASTVSGTKDFVALNRSLSGRTRIRSTKVDSSKFDLEKKPCNRQDDSLSHVRTLERKRRTPNVTQVEGTASFNSVSVKQRNLRSDAQDGKRRDFDVSSLNSSKIKSKRGGQGKTVKVNDNKVNEVVSFTFNSPLKQKTVIPAEKEETSSENEIKPYFQRSSSLRRDALGVFLEQKLKELTSQEDEELATGAPPKKSTAMILQELICALSSEHLTCPDGHMFEEHVGFYHGAKRESLLGTSCNGNHLSPGSVLEASFSSSSLDESSGHGFHTDSMNYSYDRPEQLEHDTELLDSATSFNKGKIGCDILTDLVNQIPRVLQSLYSFGTRLTVSKLTHMKDVILNAELVLGIVTEHSEDGVHQLLIARFLLDELDTMADDAMWSDFNGCVDCEDSKQRSQLMGFLFDCVIEYLESNFCRYCYCALKAWTKPTLCMKAEMLVQQIKRGIKNWACIAGLAPDEIIEWEMSHSLGKWTNFDIEAFEASVDIDGDILQVLVDEIVKDLVDCKQVYV